VSLKKLFKEKLGVKAKIGMAGLGMLDVFADGKLVFSYKQAGHMPEDDEILGLLRAT
jgi:predicted Rdx family selenoprotein